MSDIFVSYSRQNEDFGRRLHSRLTRMKRDVWMDWEDIPFNSDWWDEIKRGIETSDNFLIILTNEFVRSPVCMLEVDYARQNNKRILVVAHNFEEGKDTYEELKKRTSQSETVRQLLGERDIVNISRENWTSIGHVNWQFFNDDTSFEMDFHNLIETLDTDLNHVRSHTNLQVRALEWYTNEKNWSFLLTGVQIDQAEKWLYDADVENKVPPPTFVQREFIETSRQQQDEQEQSIQEMQNRAKRFRQASIIAGVIAAVMLVVGIGLSIWTGVQANNASNQLATAGEQVADAQNQQSTANAQALNAGETLTSIPPTFEAIQLQVNENNTQVAAVGETLTPIGATLAFAENEREQAQISANTAGTQVALADTALENANALLTPVAVTLTQSANEQATASIRVAVANNSLATANADSLIAKELLISAQTQVANAETQIEDANTALNQAIATLSPIAPTLTQASIQIINANEASTQSAAQLATATVQIAIVSTEVAEGNAVLTQIVPTLTQASDLVMDADTQVANAGTQVADVDNQIATADTQNQNLASTAGAIREIAEINRLQAQSQSLVVNAEQVALNGDIDLALALLIESYAIDPDLPQTRRLLNDIAYTSARFILEDVTFATFNSDSSLVVYGIGNEVVILDIDSRSEVTRLNAHTDRVVAGEFNYAGNLFITGSADASLIVWDTSTWNIVRTFDNLPAPVTDVAFDTRGTKIGAVVDNDVAIIWDIDSDYEAVEFDFQNPDTRLTQIEFYGDGSRFMAWGLAGTDEVLYRVNILEQSFVRQIDLIYTTLNPAYNVPDGHVARWAMIDTESFLTVYNLIQIGNDIHFTTGFNRVRGEDSAGVRAFSSSGGQVVVSLANESDGTNDIVLFDVGQRDRSSGLEFQGNGTDRVTALAFSPDGRTILSGNGRYLILWDVENGRELRRFGAHLDDIIEIQYSLDSNHAITLSRDGNYRVWDVAYSDPAVIGRIFVPNSSGAPAANPGLSPDNSQINFSIASDIYGFDTFSGEQTRATFSYFGLQDIFYSRTDTFIMTSSENTPNVNSNAMMWDVSTDNPQLWVDELGDASNIIDPVGAYSLDGRQIALASSNFIQVYDVTEPFAPELTIELDRRGIQIGALTFSPDGRVVYAAVNQLEGETAFAIVSWDTITEEQSIVLMPHIRPINAIDISMDGTQILTASADRTVVLFDIENEAILRRMVGHRGAVNEVYFGQDDTVALSASDDGSLILWDLRTGQSIRRYVTGNPITGLYLSNDNSLAVSTDGTDFVSIWQIETLDDVIAWIQENREIPEITVEQCRQYDIDCNRD